MGEVETTPCIPSAAQLRFRPSSIESGAGDSKRNGGLAGRLRRHEKVVVRDLEVRGMRLASLRCSTVIHPYGGW
jgi:hypothetical protein